MPKPAQQIFIVIDENNIASTGDTLEEAVRNAENESDGPFELEACEVFIGVKIDVEKKYVVKEVAEYHVGGTPI